MAQAAKKAQPKAEPGEVDTASPAVGPVADATLDEALARIAELTAQLEARDAAPSDEPELGDGPADMCAEHFPQGFASDIVKWIEERTGRQHEVSCEHGTYRRAQA